MNYEYQLNLNYTWVTFIRRLVAIHPGGPQKANKRNKTKEPTYSKHWKEKEVDEQNVYGIRLTHVSQINDGDLAQRE